MEDFQEQLQTMHQKEAARAVNKNRTTFNGALLVLESEEEFYAKLNEEREREIRQLANSMQDVHHLWIRSGELIVRFILTLSFSYFS